MLELLAVDIIESVIRIRLSINQIKGSVNTRAGDPVRRVSRLCLWACPSGFCPSTLAKVLDSSRNEQ